MSWILNAFCKRDVLSITPEPLQTFQVSSRGHSGPKMERALNEVIWALLVLGAPVEPFLHFMHVSSDSVPQLVLVSLDPFEFVLRISFVAWCLYTTLTACMIWIRPWILTAFVENKRWNIQYSELSLEKKRCHVSLLFPASIVTWPTFTRQPLLCRSSSAWNSLRAMLPWHGQCGGMVSGLPVLTWTT